MDYDPLTVIPGLWDRPNYRDEALTSLENAFADTGAKQIIIMDPYLEPWAIQKTIELFAKRMGREIIFLTRLKNAEKGDKEELERKTKEAQLETIRKGIFKDFSIRKTRFEFHDRYIVSREGKGDDLYLLVNTSLGTIYKKFSGTLRITNRSYRRQVDAFIIKAIEQSEVW
ncbi:hypothetical protein HOP61_21355 [Halomonas daqingensis]|uniref:Uncharacterized protein n=1 Tax=Billgrantia desiderata TaxID=52021 RepID=A0AAW4Z3Q1_9GAMM|nr:hypothetical protein [Halomonas desiderata]MCE8053845.1 hypothetical protein [Halomonas desiderata]